MRRIRLPLDGDAVEYDVEGDVAYGPNEVLLVRDDDLLARTPFAAEGFTVEIGRAHV